MADETINLGPSKRVWLIALGFMLLALLAIIPQVLWENWLCENPWFHSSLVDGPAFAAAIIAWFELRHSGEANEARWKLNEEVSGLRGEVEKLRNELAGANDKANDYLSQRNKFEQENVELRERLAKATEQIAENTKRPVTKAQRNAAVLRKYLRKMVVVQNRGSQSSLAYEIVEVSDDEIVTLFYPAGQLGTKAYYYKADCGELSVDELPYGGCAVRITVDRYLALEVGLGETKIWEDRYRVIGAPPSIDKGGMAWHAGYNKPGTVESRHLRVYQSKDGSNKFQLEDSNGETFVGDNLQISKHCMMKQVEILAKDFMRYTSGTGAIQGGYKLYMC